MTQDVMIKIRGDSAQVEQAFQKTAKAGSSAMGQIISAQQAVVSKTSALVGVIAGLGASFSAMAVVQGIRQQIDFADALDESAQKAAVSTKALSELAYVGKFAGLQVDDLVKVLAKVNEVSAKVAAGDKALKPLFTDTLGVKVRDSAGQMRNADQVLMDLIDTISRIDNQTVRAAAAADVFGEKLGPQLLPLINLTRQGVEDLRKEANELGVVITDKTGAAAADLNDRLEKLKSVQEGIYNEMATRMVPGLTSTAQLFLENYRTSGLFVAMLQTLGQRMREAFGYSDLDEQGRTAHASAARVRVLVNEIERLTELDRKNPGALVENGYGAPAIRATEKVKTLRAEVDKLLQQSVQASAKLKGMADEVAGVKPDGAPKVVPAARSVGIQDLSSQAQAAAARAARAEAARAQNDLRRQQREAYEDRVGQLRSELALWRNNTEQQRRIAEQIAEQARKQFGEQSREYAAARQELVRIDQRAADQRRQIEQELGDSMRASALAEVEMARAQADQDVAMGRLSAMQRLDMERGFQEQLTDIKRASLIERLDVLARDPDANPVERERIYRQIEELEREHQARMGEIRGAREVEGARPRDAVVGSLQDSIQQGTTALIMGQQSAAETLRNIWRQTASAFVTEMITRPFAEWAAHQARMTVATIMGVNTRTAVEVAGAEASSSITSAQAMKTIGIKAYEAAAGVYASIASIPVVGPFMAPAMATAAMATVLSYGGKLFSAEGGFDIPAGVNPMVQAHAREMVLPAKHADVIRRLGDIGMGNGGGDTVNLNVQALDARTFEAWLKGRGGDAVIREISVRRRSNRGG